MKVKKQLLAGLILLASAVGSAEPLMVTHLQGTPTGKQGALQLLQKIQDGESFTLGEKSTLTLTSLANGTRYTVSGPVKGTVKAVGVAVAKGQESHLKIVPGRSVSQKKPKDVSATMGGTLVRSDGFKLLTVQRLSSPTLRWEQDHSATLYEVNVWKGKDHVFEGQTKELSLSVPLLPNQDYKVAVVSYSETAGIDNTDSEFQPSLVTVSDVNLSEPDSPALQLARDLQARPEILDTDPSQLTVTVSYLLEQGFFYDAWELLNQHENEEGVKLLRAKVIGVIGRTQELSAGSDL